MPTGFYQSMPMTTRSWRIRWGPAIYLDTALPFGLCSAPKIFSAFADAQAWVMHSNDFRFFGAASNHEWASSLQTGLRVCQRLGIPVAAHKTEGPSTCLTFIGIQIDSVAMQLSLPPDKLSQTCSRQVWPKMLCSCTCCAVYTSTWHILTFALWPST